MPRPSLNICVTLVTLVSALAPASGSAQVVESVGTRALGMGGAFVAVANDSSATWWNPAGLAAGPFVDVTISGGRAGSTPPGRLATWGLAVAMPALGASYYRLRITDIDSIGPTVAPEPGRQEGRVGVLPESLGFDQFGATLVHTVFPKVHAGATLKVVRPSADGAVAGMSPGSHFDADVGVLGIVGPVRIGVAARQLFEPTLWTTGGPGPDQRLARQVRVGVAFDGDLLGVDRSLPLVLAVDADARAYDTLRGPRRAIAVGAERWVSSRRFGVRGGARFNTVGGRERVASVGASLALARGIMAEVHASAGNRAERGWGIAARASF